MSREHATYHLKLTSPSGNATSDELQRVARQRLAEMRRRHKPLQVGGRRFRRPKPRAPLPEYEVFSVAKRAEAEASSDEGMFQECGRTRQKWRGACLDTGAQRTVIGREQARAYSKFLGYKRMKLIPSRAKFRFGTDRQQSLGKMPIRVPVKGGSMMMIMAEVVPIDVPFLLGLDVLDKFQLVVDNVDMVLDCRVNQQRLPIVRKGGHLYLEWGAADKIFFSRDQLTKLHRGFHHPSAQKLHELLKRSKAKDLKENTLDVLKDIIKHCDPCQRVGPTPVRFRASIPEEELVFGDELSIDLVWVEGDAFLHVVDTATRFSATTFLDWKPDSVGPEKDYGQSVDGVWEAFIECWCTLYTGYPNRLRTDAGSIFTSPRWEALAEDCGISMSRSGIESHNSLGLGEKMHDPLKRVYRKIKLQDSELDRVEILRLATKAVNDTVGINGLVPSYLVFGIMPRFPTLPSKLPQQRRRMQILSEARAEYERAIAELRIATVLRHNIPSAADRTYRIGDQILIYREKDKEWVGPKKVTKVNDKIVTVEYDDELKEFSKAKCKPYFEGEEEVEAELVDVLHNALRPFQSEVQETRIGAEDIATILATEVIKAHDPRARMFDEAKAKEIRGLIDRGTWKVVFRREVPHGANIMGGRFVLAIKEGGTDKELYKARYVVQGFRDKMKTSLVHDSATSRQASARVLVGLAAAFEFELFSTDVTQAYLQSATPLQREVYIKPGKDFGLGSDKLLKLLRPLYGLADSGDYWGATFSQHITKELGMEPTIGDSAFFYKNDGGRLVGMTTTYVDDALQAGTPGFSKLVEKTEKEFECKPREYDRTTFVGKRINRCDDGFTIDQSQYVDRLKMLKASDEKGFKSLRAKLLWTQNSRPDISCAVAKLAQVTDADLKTDPETCIKMANRIVRHLKKHSDVKLRYRKLDTESLCIRMYSDASYADNRDASSQLGYIVFLCDKFGTAQPITWSSHKSKRVTRSVLGSETMALADGFDAAYAIRHDVERMTGKRVPLSVFTDSLSLFDVITKATLTAERRLMIDIAGVKQAYKTREIHTIGFIRTQYNPADALTKVRPCGALDDVLQSGRLSHPVAQWVDRQSVTPTDLDSKAAPGSILTNEETTDEQLGEC